MQEHPSCTCKLPYARLQGCKVARFSKTDTIIWRFQK